ncbi:MAG: hypothetical protein M1817_002294 [Caeruleum heppii]|nr:MAG: hypothetical protein M1817_003522 [Caeruleum heppii]KAI9673657.1 MAG: hypothetical protein M1817_002294 [Caeruleum heppii]
MASASPYNESRTESVGRKRAASPQLIVLSDSDDHTSRKRRKQNSSDTEDGLIQSPSSQVYEAAPSVLERTTAASAAETGSATIVGASGNAQPPQPVTVPPVTDERRTPTIWNAGAKSKIRTTLGGGPPKAVKLPSRPTQGLARPDAVPSAILDDVSSNSAVEVSNDSTHATLQKADGAATAANGAPLNSGIEGDMSGLVPPGPDQHQFQPVFMETSGRPRENNTFQENELESPNAHTNLPVVPESYSWDVHRDTTLLVHTHVKTVSNAKLSAHLSKQAHHPIEMFDGGRHVVLRYPNKELADAALQCIRRAPLILGGEKFTVGACKKNMPQVTKPDEAKAHMPINKAAAEATRKSTKGTRETKTKAKDVGRQKAVTNVPVSIEQDGRTDSEVDKLNGVMSVNGSGGNGPDENGFISLGNGLSESNTVTTRVNDTSQRVSMPGGGAEMSRGSSSDQYEPGEVKPHRTRILAELSEADRNLQIRYTQITRTTSFLDDPNIVGQDGSRGVDLQLPVRCLVCGIFGHLETDKEECQATGKGGRCERCLEHGHRKPECPSKLARSAAAGDKVTCETCHTKGHFEYSCPYRLRSYIPASNPSDIRKVRELPVGCYNCGSDSHYAADCNRPRYGGSNQERDITFCHANAKRYLDPESSNTAIALPHNLQAGFQIKGRAPPTHGPRSAQPPTNRKKPSRIPGAPNNPVTLDENNNDDDDESSFLRARITRAAEPTRSHIRFPPSGGLVNAPPGNTYRPPGPSGERHPLPRRPDANHARPPPYGRDSSDHYRPRSPPPPAEPLRVYPHRPNPSSYRPGRDRNGGDRGDRWAPAPPPPPPPSSRGRGGGGGGRGGPRSGNGNATTYRPMPSAGKEAWRKHRI